jgi:hypothetical protein
MDSIKIEENIIKDKVKFKPLIKLNATPSKPPCDRPSLKKAARFQITKLPIIPSKIFNMSKATIGVVIIFIVFNKLN